MTFLDLSQQPIAAHQGISLLGTLQAVGGIVALLLIAYLCSNNRKAINWKTVGFGLLLQLVLAISILKLSCYFFFLSVYLDVTENKKAL